MDCVHRSGWLAILVALALVGAAAGQPQPGDSVAAAQRFIDGNRPQAAVEMADRLLEASPGDGELLLLRSTANFMLGELDAGAADLDAALKAAPELRQGWLNKAALQMSRGAYEEALASLTRARDLDPSAPDNDINLGAVRLLLGDLDAATEHFRRHLAGHPSDAGAHYLVATNYAMAGYAAFAIQYLQQAVAIDERVRVRARVDPNFLTLAEHPRFQQLMADDSWSPPPSYHATSRTFNGAYDGGDGPLLPAVLDALHEVRQSYEPTVEKAPDWALIWGEMRIEVRDGAEPGQGVVELSAPPDRLSATEWEHRTKLLLDSIFIQVQRRL